MFINAVNKVQVKKPEPLNLTNILKEDRHSTKTRIKASLGQHYRAAKRAKEKSKNEYYFSNGDINLQFTAHRSPTPNMLKLFISNSTQDNQMCKVFTIDKGESISSTITLATNAILEYLDNALLELDVKLDEIGPTEFNLLTTKYFI